MFVHESLQQRMAQWEGDSSLVQESQLFRRMNVLDQLDVWFPFPDAPSSESSPVTAELQCRAKAICARLEAANSAQYHSIRHEIRQGLCPEMFLHLIRQSNSEHRAIRPICGIGYDHVDQLISGVFDIDEPSGEPAHTGPENVFYQPTPARHIFSFIAAGALSADDILLDLGSGLGHVPSLVSICTGARAIGVELQPGFVASAERCAQKLNLRRVRFVQQDAREADLSGGTVFYFYTPFTGSILRTVLNSLRDEAANRPIKVCTFGPCTLTIAQEPWLEPRMSLKTDQIIVFLSRN
jgi:hypothetical protein